MRTHFSDFLKWRNRRWRGVDGSLHLLALQKALNDDESQTTRQTHNTVSIVFILSC